MNLRNSVIAVLGLVALTACSAACSATVDDPTEDEEIVSSEQASLTFSGAHVWVPTNSQVLPFRTVSGSGQTFGRSGSVLTTLNQLRGSTGNVLVSMKRSTGETFSSLRPYRVVKKKNLLTLAIENAPESAPSWVKATWLDKAEKEEEDACESVLGKLTELVAEHCESPPSCGNMPKESDDKACKAATQNAAILLGCALSQFYQEFRCSDLREPEPGDKTESSQNFAAFVTCEKVAAKRCH